MSNLYSMDEFTNSDMIDADVFVVTLSQDERSYATARILKKSNKISTIILISYFEDYSSYEEYLKRNFPNSNIYVVVVSNDIQEFIFGLSKFEDKLLRQSILIDITALRIPEMFAIMKYIWINDENVDVTASYTTPVEYEFAKEPFMSYHSYWGNLVTTELLGFGGESSDMSYNKMVIFLGFEGVLSEKVSEDTKYDKLILVNSLPCFFEKYKDISIINNYNLISSSSGKISYVPANNPFETYNFLCDILKRDNHDCIAPLGTKPVALGVCMYGLNHQEVRVIYPTSDEYNFHKSNGIHKTYLYKSLFKNL